MTTNPATAPSDMTIRELRQVFPEPLRARFDWNFLNTHVDHLGTVVVLWGALAESSDQERLTEIEARMAAANRSTPALTEKQRQSLESWQTTMDEAADAARKAGD